MIRRWLCRVICGGEAIHAEHIATSWGPQWGREYADAMTSLLPTCNDIRLDVQRVLVCTRNAHHGGMHATIRQRLEREDGRGRWVWWN